MATTPNDEEIAKLISDAAEANETGIVTEENEDEVIAWYAEKMRAKKALQPDHVGPVHDFDVGGSD